VPILQSSSPASLVAGLLTTHLGDSRTETNIHDYVFIDFCAGGGGPTPSIERHVNIDQQREHIELPEPVQFVLTDLHPHVELWSQAAAQSPNLSYVRESVDASRAPRDLTARYTRQGKKKVFRLFNLAFHHFDDALARRILRDTVEGSHGFG
jgi:hypothetical protein